MAAFQQLRLRYLDLEGDHQARTVGVVTLALDAVEEEEGGLMTDGPTMIGDPVEVCHQASGGGVKHHQSESPATAEEEEAVVVLEQDQTATGMGVEGEDGDLLQVSTSHECRQGDVHKPVPCPHG